MKRDTNTNHKLRAPSPGPSPEYWGGGLSAETQLSFAAAAGCFVIGIIGYGINALTTMETTLSAFLVIGAFYALLGVSSLFKQPEHMTAEEPQELGEEQVESAA